MSRCFEGVACAVACVRVRCHGSTVVHTRFPSGSPSSVEAPVPWYSRRWRPVAVALQGPALSSVT
eukprot:495594-Prymnesium_polylepis.1